MLIDNTNKIIQQYNEAIEKIMQQIGIVGLAQIQLDTPVLTGNLRRSYTYKNTKSGNTFYVVFGTNVPYAFYVEMKPESHGGRPHLRQAMQTEIQEFKEIITQHLSGLGR